jgi:class 3 adenylate cyclase
MAATFLRRWLSSYFDFLASVGLAFRDAKDERLFVESYVYSVARATQIFLAVGGLSFLKYVEQDVLIDPDNYQTANNIRIFYSTPLIGLCVFSIFIDFFKKRIEYIVVANGFIIISAQAWIFSTLQSGYNFATVGFAIIFLALSIAFIIRVTFLATIAFFSLVGTIGGHIYANNADPGWLVVNTIGILTAILLGMVSAVIRERSARVQFMATRALDVSQERAEALLGSMLPGKIVGRIQAGETSIADALDEVSIVFADIAGFTSLSRRLSPTDLIRLLDNLFSRFDAAAERCAMEKITTIGDAYMAVGGMDGTLTTRQLAQNASRLALAIREEVIAMIAETDYPINVRVGVHIGPIVAGVVGERRPTFDCWGDTVRIASGLEGHAGSGHIMISDEVAKALGDTAQTGSAQTFMIKDIADPINARELHALRDESAFCAA